MLLKPVRAVRRLPVALLAAVVLGPLVAIVGAPPAGAWGSTISTFAGTGTAGYTGDGGPATAAQISITTTTSSFAVWGGIGADASGNVYLADPVNHVVRKVDTSGVISTVAGTGAFGSTGDGGLATAATFNTPRGVAVDAAGNLFIADTGNAKIRKVDTSGVVTTVVGTGTPGSTGDGGPATAATINEPLRVLPVGNTLYIADRTANKVRFVDGSGVISTFAGSGSGGTAGDGGPAALALLNRPVGLAQDASGNVYIAHNTFPGKIRKVDTAGTITTFAGAGTSAFGGDGGPATTADLSFVADLAFDAAGRLLVADGANNRIRRIDTSGFIYTVVSDSTEFIFGFGGDGGNACFADISRPGGMALKPNGDLLFADQFNHRLRAVVAPMPNCPVPVRGLTTDFDWDNKADIALYRPDSGTWFSHPTGGDPDAAVDWGVPGDIPVPGDYDGDTHPDQAVYRPSTGLWAIHKSNGGDDLISFGGVGSDIPVPADFTGDGKTDIAIYRPQFGFWYIRPSSGGADQAYKFGGIAGDLPAPADYNGDGKADRAIFRPSAGTWFVSPSGTAGGDFAVAYGTAGDIPIAADYEGDGKADIAVFRPTTGLWATRFSSGAPDTFVTYGGIAGDVPVPTDYDGDRKADMAIFRPSLAVWWVHQTTNGADVPTTFGVSTDKALVVPPAVRLAFFP